MVKMMVVWAVEDQKKILMLALRIMTDAACHIFWIFWMISPIITNTQPCKWDKNITRAENQSLVAITFKTLRQATMKYDHQSHSNRIQWHLTTHHIIIYLRWILSNSLPAENRKIFWLNIQPGRGWTNYSVNVLVYSLLQDELVLH